jgi:hypothetical protein
MSFSWQDSNAIGLISDMIGILILGVPAVLAPSKLLAQESTSGYGGASKGLARRLSEWKIDTCVASLFLALGFLFQFIASIGYSIIFKWAVAIWVLLFLALSLYLLFRKSMISRYTAIIQKHWGI